MRPDHARLLELNASIATACAHDLKERYARAEALRADLRLLDAGKSVKRRRSVQRGWAWTWKMAAVLALVALAFVLLRNERDCRAALARLNASPFEKSGTTNYPAWEALQRGVQMGNTYTTVGLSNVLREWEHAIELDPNYAAAWSTLSRTLAIAVTEGHLPGTNVLPRAKFCVEKAIALDPQRGDAYEALAICNLGLNFGLSVAEPLFGKPRSSTRKTLLLGTISPGTFSTTSASLKLSNF